MERILTDVKRRLVQAVNLAHVDAHGGLTFTGPCTEPGEGEDRRERICHVSREGEPANVWWVGFDCAHAWDLVPALVARESAMGFGPLPARHEAQARRPHDTYRTLASSAPSAPAWPPRRGRRSPEPSGSSGRTRGVV